MRKKEECGRNCKLSARLNSGDREEYDNLKDCIGQRLCLTHYHLPDLLHDILRIGVDKLTDLICEVRRQTELAHLKEKPRKRVA